MATDKHGIWKKDKDHFIHPYTDFSTFRDEGSQVITGGSGAYIEDIDGNKYLDGIAGLWCVNIGHGRKEMADAISAQVTSLQYYNPFGHTTNVPAAELAERLANICPSNLNHVFYSTGGSTANDTAVRIVHHYFNRRGQYKKKKIISRMDAYHGSTYFAATLTGIHGTKDGFDGVGDYVDYVSPANMYRKPTQMSSTEYCDYLVIEFENRILQIGPDNVAAFIAEPIMGAGGVLVAPDGYHKRMYDICKKYDMLYISDEVVTAFGRLGAMIASEDVFGVRPDIICLAKGITSGYIPLGATMISDEIYEVIATPQSVGGALTMGFTYSGHAVACAAALKNIEILENEGICGHVKQQGPGLLSQLSSLSSYSMVGDVRGSHFMIGLELVEDRASKKGFDVTVGSATRVFEACRDRGLIVRPIGNIIVISPPLTLTENDCSNLYSILDESLADVSNDLVGEGFLAA